MFLLPISDGNHVLRTRKRALRVDYSLPLFLTARLFVRGFHGKPWTYRNRGENESLPRSRLFSDPRTLERSWTFRLGYRSTRISTSMYHRYHRTNLFILLTLDAKSYLSRICRKDKFAGETLVMFARGHKYYLYRAMTRFEIRRNERIDFWIQIFK